jgi:hypothetical protein
VYVITRIKPVPSRGQGRRAVGLIMVFWALLPVVAVSAVLNADRQLSTDGVVQLNWSEDGRPVLLQRAVGPDLTAYRTLYRGTDSASLRTGLPDGDYSFRLRPLDRDGQPWSAPVQVRVRHHDAVRTWGLFGVGATVFLATLGLILWGCAREAEHE